jgi:hypothetical protein
MRIVESPGMECDSIPLTPSTPLNKSCYAHGVQLLDLALTGPRLSVWIYTVGGENSGQHVRRRLAELNPADDQDPPGD